MAIFWLRSHIYFFSTTLLVISDFGWASLNLLKLMKTVTQLQAYLAVYYLEKR